MKPTKLGVHIKTKDISKSAYFYEKFGFEPIFAYGNAEFLKRFDSIPTAPENYNGITYSLNESLLEIADGHLAVKPSVFKETVESSKISLTIDCDSVEEIQKVAESNGFEIAVPIREFPWGSTEIVIRDPDGVILVFRVADYID